MDRNSIIGFGLLALLFFGYFYYTQQGRSAYEAEQKHIQDSLNRLKPPKDTAIVATVDSTALKTPAPVGFLTDTNIVEKSITVENDVVKITFSNRGGQPQIVELKEFKTFDGQPLILNDGSFNKLSYPINTGNGNTVQSGDLLFKTLPIQQRGKNKVVSFVLNAGNERQIIHEYVFKPDSYLVEFNIRMKGANSLVTNNTLHLAWDVKARQQEKDLSYEIQQSHFSYVSGDEFDYEQLSMGSQEDKTFQKPLDWIALNQQFFISSLVAPEKFTSGTAHWETPDDTSKNIVGKLKADVQLNIPSGNTAVIPLKFYYGPSDYDILKSYDNQMYNMVPLGYGIFAFVKYINRGFIMPVFNWLATFISSYGLIIMLLTIIIRLLISPLTYQSYLSGAKMKLMRPEIDELKKKYADDKQAFGMEQLKLFKSAGVNPLGGCIPALLQIPIFFALYAFFNSSILLRGESFLWASDLSTYDSIINLPFTIPFYGDHVSLFTILATITSLAISLYGMSNMQDTGNPVMKYMPYIFPVVLLGVFNNMPSALTWYYTVSNVITLVIQFVIQNYIIDHDRLMAKLQEKKKKPVKKNKWQERVEAMQQSQQKLKQLKERTEAGRRK